MEVKLDGLYKRPKKLADGTETAYDYAWRGPGSPRLKSEPGALESIAEFQEAQKQRHAPFNDTVSGLIDEYSKSHEFTKLARLTKRDHIAMFARIEKRFGKMPIEALEDKRVRSDFKRWRDGISSDRQADRAWSSLKRVFSYALDGGRISWNPCAGGGKRYHGDRSECVWTDAQIQAFLQSAPKHLQLPFLFAFHTGQRQGDILRLWLEVQILPTFSDRILLLDVAVAKRAAQLHIPDPRSDRDAIIAATALVHGMTVVTRNTCDFEQTGVEILNPWRKILS